ncbi:HPP family protein+B94 [Streptomyces sp. ZL-24]|uniref:HPP family protein n=1 Tax=Streptomyces sp. ZL-24 TaxID=1933029 RepID=UPI000CD481C7|nr:HPP family protein [Streptomyces sp. ZL-24]POG48636.1 HPP family protein+B94 [Streptomyces sp. ZL-24]
MSDAPSTTLPAPTRTPSLLTSKAPPRPKPSFVSVATAGGTVALVLLVAIGYALDQTVLIPPLAASAALVFAAPTLPLAQPRNVIGGQLVSALTGFVVLAVAGSSVWASAVAGGLAIGAMALARTAHSPAAATAVIVVVAQPSTLLFLALLLLATVVIVGVGVLAGHTGRTARYPTYWW